MTTIYDPTDSDYTDEAAVRTELTRVFDVCQSCRQCVDLCGVFPTLFEMLDAHDEPDAGRMTPAEQDRVTDACVQCTLCSSSCPYSPGRHDAAVDVPRLMLRSAAMRRARGHLSRRSSMAARLLRRVDALGKMATRSGPAANRVIAAPPGSALRRIATKSSGLSSLRRLPTFASQRFSSWFSDRPRIIMHKKQASVSVFPTCLVEYQATDIGKDLVKVYERNGIECTQSEARCCGAPSLHAGDIDRFAKIATKNVATMVREVRLGADIVVAQPTCSNVIKHHYVEHLADGSVRADAELVAERTYDACEYLMTLHSGDDYVLDTHFDGDTPRRVDYHVPSQLRAQHGAFTSRDLLKLTGTTVRVVQEDAGINSLWGLRADADDPAAAGAQRLSAKIEHGAGDAIAGDCHLANTAIEDHTGRPVHHPLQIVARAYGLSDET